MPLPLFWILGAAGVAAAAAATAWAASDNDETVTVPDEAGELREREAERDREKRRERAERWKERGLHDMAGRHSASGRSPSGLTCAEYWRSEAAPGAGQADRVEKALDMFLPTTGPSDAENEAAALLREEDDLGAMKTAVAAMRARAQEQLEAQSQSAPPHRSET